MTDAAILAGGYVEGGKIGGAGVVYQHSAGPSPHLLVGGEHGMAEEQSIPFGFCHCGCGGRTKLATRICRRRGHVIGQPYQYINGHNERLHDNDKAWLIKFFTWVDRRGENDCWEWLASKSAGGYGRVSYKGRTVQATRAIYTVTIGPIPTGLVLDHLCRNRACVNPAHLRVCTMRENTLAPGSLSFSAVNAAKTHCPAGHELVKVYGGRGCKKCANLRRRRRSTRLERTA